MPWFDGKRVIKYALKRAAINTAKSAAPTVALVVVGIVLTVWARYRK